VNIKSVMFILQNFWGGYLVVVSIRRNVIHSACTDKPYLEEKEEQIWQSDAVWKCWSTLWEYENSIIMWDL